MTDKVNAACGREDALGQGKFVVDKGTSKGATVFMNNVGHVLRSILQPLLASRRLVSFAA
jgi:hypothetical protein